MNAAFILGIYFAVNQPFCKSERSTSCTNEPGFWYANLEYYPCKATKTRLVCVVENGTSMEGPIGCNCCTEVFKAYARQQGMKDEREIQPSPHGNVTSETNTLPSSILAGDGTNSSKKLSSGIVAGIVAACIAAIALVAGIVICRRKRRQQQQQVELNPPDDSKIPFGIAATEDDTDNTDRLSCESAI